LKYISIDIETTGLDTEQHQILEFGAVYEDTNNILPLEKLPKFHAYITHPDGMLTGNIFAFDLNADIIKKLINQKELEDKYKFVKPEHLAHDFLFWLFDLGFEMDIKNKNKKNEYFCSELINIAGKNFEGFDRKFLNKIPNFSKYIRIRKRILDPAIICVDWKNDTFLPSLEECNKRVGYMGDVKHNAIDDALDVIRILRTRYC